MNMRLRSLSERHRHLMETPSESSSFLNISFQMNLTPSHEHSPALLLYLLVPDAAGRPSPPEEEVIVRSEKFWDALGVLDVAAERSHFLPNSEPA